MASLPDIPELTEPIIATKPDDGMSAYVANPEGIEWSPPVPDKILTKEEIYKILDELNQKEDSFLLQLPEQYCDDRNIDYEERHKPSNLRECLDYKKNRREENMRIRLRKKLEDKKNKQLVDGK